MFAQPDTIIPGQGDSYTALIVDYHEIQFLAQLNNENRKRIDDPRAKFPQIPINSAAFDRYSYVLNNPVRYNDPSGHAQCGNWQNGCDEETGMTDAELAALHARRGVETASLSVVLATQTMPIVPDIRLPTTSVPTASQSQTAPIIPLKQPIQPNVTKIVGGILVIGITWGITGMIAYGVSTLAPEAIIESAFVDTDLYITVLGSWFLGGSAVGFNWIYQGWNGD